MSVMIGLVFAVFERTPENCSDFSRGFRGLNSPVYNAMETLRRQVAFLSILKNRFLKLSFNISHL
jgi:hypothetical protein